MSTLSVRRPLSVVAVLAMVATMLFAVAGTASAAATPANLATFNACPDNSGIPDAGFDDIPTASFFDDAVNCLKYYTVTTGSTPTMYEPAEDVTRAQMALFLARSAAAAGVVLKASPPSAGFTDISELSAEAQLAINQLADAGIVKGKTATTYGPAQTVWRQQMALFLTRFLGEAVVGPGGTALAGAATTGSPFTDLGNTTVEASKAINQAWDLGIAAGDTATTYDPLGNVNRGQMSLFLTRLYAHTNTRPGGVNIQAAPVAGFGAFASNISVTARATDFTPSVNTEVDVWRFDPSTTVTTPFNANGTCNLASGLITIPPGAGGATACTLELIDPSTDLNGNWPVFVENALDGAASSFYAWTGAVGSTFDNDTTVSSMVAIGSTKDATDAKLTTDMKKNAAQVKFGTTVTLTVQLMDGPGATAKPVAKSGVAYTFTDTKTVDGAPAGVTVTLVKTDAAGKATYQVTQSDPGALPATDNDAKNVVVVAGAPAAVGTPITIDWNDDAADALTVVAATATEYKVQSNGATNSATATVYDQYGMPMAGVQVAFSSTDDADHADGIGAAIMRTTGSNGVATLGYTWTYTAPSTDVTAEEEITAIEQDNFNSDGVDFFWVDKAVDGDYESGVGDDVTNLADDIDNDSVVGLFGADDYLLFAWDGNDQFNETVGTPITQTAFETNIKAGGDFDVRYDDTAANVSEWWVQP